MKKTGQLGERIVEKYFIRKGHTIVSKNIWLKRFGEVDLITQKNKIFYFIEVKTLKENEDFSPEIHYDSKKKRKFHSLINYFANRYDLKEFKSLLATVKIGKKIKIKIYENV